MPVTVIPIDAVIRIRQVHSGFGKMMCVMGVVVTADELDEVLLDRFNLSRADLIAALKMLPEHRPWAATLTAEEARLFDDAGFVEDPEAHTEIAVEVIAHMARLISTAYTAAEVAAGLGVNVSRVRQRRLARTLWAIDSTDSWRYPAVQFERVEVDGRNALRQVRGLDQVLPALPANLHPTAVAGFLFAPQRELSLDGRPRAPRDWLNSGGAVDPVLRLIEIGEWSGR